MSKKPTFKGIGFTGILTILFIVLKLTGVITWSWFWVLSPIILSAILTISIGIIAFIIIGINAVVGTVTGIGAWRFATILRLRKKD